MPFALEATGLHLAWRGRQLFAGLNFALNEGEVLALIGPSGCGKTTLLQTLACLLTPDAGQVLVRGELRNAPGHACYLPQHDSLMPWLRLVDNLLLPLRLRGEDVRVKNLDVLLAQFGLEEAKGLFPHQMSGGMRQRAALLRAHLGGAKLLLLDEPLGALDAITRQSTQQWLADSLWRMRASAVVVTHDVEEALLLGDRIEVMTELPARLTSVGECLPRHERFVGWDSTQMLEMRHRLWDLLDPARTRTV